MNISLILSGGVGKRFESDLPKQYNMINGRPVIDYVIDACLKSELTDAIVVVCDFNCVCYSSYLQDGSVHLAQNGKERYDSLNNGLEYIKNNFECKKVCVFDAAAPLIYPRLVDEYFSKLDEYDAVITCQKITGELGNYNYDILNRTDYYMTQSPESFRFDLLCKHFDPSFPSTELVNQLPRDINRYLNFEFKTNLKITYDSDLTFAEAMIRYYQNKKDRL